MNYKQIISKEALGKALALRDLTDPTEGKHCMQLLVEQVTSELQDAWGIPCCLHRGHRVVSVADNYDHLRYPQQAVTRAERYSRYVDQEHLLRTHTSALIPGLLRNLDPDTVEDLLLACPGPVWRRDVIDKTHIGEPHQMDLWRISRQEMQSDDLEEMIHVVASVLAPGKEIRISKTKHPYTLEGREIEVLHEGNWLEIGECGLAHPEVLAGAREDATGRDQYHGLAMGIGLERAVMLRKGIDDIRLLRSEDPRVASQMLDLEPYHQVSAQPPARRDISIAMQPDIAEEEIAERIRELLGDESEWLEEVRIISRTAGAKLPEAARQRIGIALDQENILLRLIIRHPVRSLPKAEANRIKDKIYVGLHEGSTYQLSGQ